MNYGGDILHFNLLYNLESFENFTMLGRNDEIGKQV